MTINSALGRGDPGCNFADRRFVGVASGHPDLIIEADRRGAWDVPSTDEDGVQQDLYYFPECDNDHYDCRFTDDVRVDRPSDSCTFGL